MWRMLDSLCGDLATRRVVYAPHEVKKVEDQQVKPVPALADYDKSAPSLGETKRFISTEGAREG